MYVSVALNKLIKYFIIVFNVFIVVIQSVI